FQLDQDWFIALPDELARIQWHRFYGHPRVVIAAGHVPSADLASGIESLAIINTRRANRSVDRAPPGSIGSHDLPRAIGEFEFKLDQQPRVRAIGKASDGHQPAGIPAFAEHGADCVLAGADYRGDVMGLILHPFAVIGPFRCQQLPADWL